MENFTSEIRKDEKGRLTFIELPFDAKEVFHISKGTIYVAGKINDAEYRSKLLSRGNGKYILVLNKALQKLIGVTEHPITVKVTMNLDQQINPQAKTISNIETAAGKTDVITAIKTRRSIRKFTSEPIDSKTLNTILNAGLSAPTAKNKKPCHFLVIKEKPSLLKLSQSNPNARMLADAHCAVIVCGDSNLEGMKEFLYADCFAASENILLCAHGLGVGAVWCGIAANSDWKKLIIQEFHLPLKVEPVSVIALGYPAEAPEQEERWDLGKIHFNNW
ncbi:MAG: nitroreductase family protein [Eubacteriales bacterium]|nr:nitroreductase family protein [Eubacteriales bacterium]